MSEQSHDPFLSGSVIRQQPKAEPNHGSGSRVKWVSLVSKFASFESKIEESYRRESKRNVEQGELKEKNKKESGKVASPGHTGLSTGNACSGMSVRDGPRTTPDQP